MKDIEFVSSSNYIYLPSKKNPRVMLSIEKTNLTKNSFKLYNPFSKKAKFLKIITQFVCENFNVVSNIFVIKKKKSNFVRYLEELLGQPLVVSLYFGTINDKIVMQLQSTDAKILGYLKYPLNEIGLKHTKNEIKAFNILSKAEVVDSYNLCGEYKNKPFLLLKELDGEIGIVDKVAIEGILKKFVRSEAYQLKEHPRVISLKKLLLANNMLTYINQIDLICVKSTLKYNLVYEHGDFAPWNIVKVKDAYIPFDFEYFVEVGLEYFDLIKYYYQIGSLLKNKEGVELKNYVCYEINLNEIEYIYDLYLIKEMLINKLETL